MPYICAVSAISAVAMHDYQGDHLIHTSVFVAGYMLVSLVMVRQVLTLLENLHLTRELRIFSENLEQTIARRTEQLTSLYELTAAVNTTLHVDQVMEAAAKFTLKALRADAIAIWLMDRNTSVTDESSPRLYLHEGLNDHAEVFRFINQLPMCEQLDTVPLPSRPGDRRELEEPSYVFRCAGSSSLLV